MGNQPLSLRRPSAKEKYDKVRDALEAIRGGNRDFATTKHIASSRDYVGASTTKEFWEIVEKLLEELLEKGPQKYYQGLCPPEKCNEPKVLDEEMWVYRWQSSSLSSLAYIKFVVKNRGGCSKSANKYVFLIICHESTR